MISECTPLHGARCWTLAGILNGTQIPKAAEGFRRLLPQSHLERTNSAWLWSLCYHLTEAHSLLITHICSLDSLKTGPKP